MKPTLKTVLGRNGASLTKTRWQLFNLLLNKGPLSTTELAELAQDKVDRATVYRTVELFEDLGIVQRINFGWKYKLELTDMFVGHHHHLHCTYCGTSYKMPESNILETMIDNVAAQSGFSPRNHTLEIYGMCQECRREAI
jgi:Fur family ferric uptake transcriptional regulator